MAGTNKTTSPALGSLFADQVSWLLKRKFLKFVHRKFHSNGGAGNSASAYVPVKIEVGICVDVHMVRLRSSYPSGNVKLKLSQVFQCVGGIIAEVF